MPEWLPSEATALAEPLACVCSCLFDPPVVSAGDDVLVVGPGPVGLLAAQAARAAGGAVHVRGTPRDARRLALARELGLASSGGDEPRHTVSQGGFAVVAECSGSEAGVAFGLERAARGGRFVQIGLGGRPVAVPLDEVCYREPTITSGNASTPASWRRALALVEARAVALEPLVSEVLPLPQWERAFARTRAGEAVKVVLDPR